MKCRLHGAIGTAICIASSMIVSMAPALAQQRPSSPLASATAERYRYPDASRLQSHYEPGSDNVVLPPARSTARAATAGLAAAARIQPRLPDGFTVLNGSTSHLPPSPATAAPGATRSASTPAPTDEKFITLFPLAYQGIPLSKGSDYLSVVDGNGRILATRRRGLPLQVDATQATVTEADAINAARQSAGSAFSSIDPGKVRGELQVWVDSQQNGNLAWTFVLDSGSVTDPDVRRYWVSAVGQPRVLDWESTVYHTQAGQVTGSLWVTSPFAATENRSLEDLEVTRNTDSATQITSSDGRYGYTTGGGNAQIRARLRGPFFFIDNQTGPAMEAAKTGTPANPIDLNFAASNEDQLAEVSAFYWANIARDLAHNVLGATDLALLQVRTNLGAVCNAYWVPQSINFYKSGSGCPNTAYSDVVMHEYGHGIDWAKGGILNGGYSEGFGDAVAVLATKQSCVGRDFFGVGSCLRNASDVILWPPATGEGVHAIGRRYAGFVWELVQQLKQTFAEDEAYDIAARLVLGAAAANPSDIVDAVRLSFIVDDNDGNLANGTPHFRALANAADSRHIPRPADPAVAGGGVAAEGQFPWTPAKVVSTNANIIQATIHLDRPGKLHIVANTSARSGSPVSFYTGVYNASATNIMWTNSLRNVTVPLPNRWTNFGTTFGIDLPAGDHTIYWKVWISGGSVTLSGGALLIEGFEPATGPSAIASLSGTAATTTPQAVADSLREQPASTDGSGDVLRPTLSTDEAGLPVTLLQQ